jgi:hypothetical protein
MARARGQVAFATPHYRPAAATEGIVRIGKVRRPVGEPVAFEKEPLRFEPAPPPNVQDFTLSLDHVIDPNTVAAIARNHKLVFHCVGDTGGINDDADTQKVIAEAMEARIQSADDTPKAAFLYLVGDVVYFNGASNLYKWQFYEPYQHYPAPILAIPGNHDGDTNVRPGDPPDPEPSLTGFMLNFCDTSPRPTQYRTTMTQPYVYWTLLTPLVTIVGLYSNVEGSLDPRGGSDQQTWLANQLAAAPADKKLIVTVHHPCYSLDASHGGSPDVLAAIDQAATTANRLPDAIISGHVHNYQRFSRTVGTKKVPYIVAGAGGYAFSPKAMHRLQPIDAARPFQTTHADVQLVTDNETDPGFLEVTVTPSDITFDYYLVPFDGSPSSLFDSLTV